MANDEKDVKTTPELKYAVLEKYNQGLSLGFIFDYVSGQLGVGKRKAGNIVREIIYYDAMKVKHDRKGGFETVGGTS